MSDEIIKSLVDSFQDLPPSYLQFFKNLIKELNESPLLSRETLDAVLKGFEEPIADLDKHVSKHYSDCFDEWIKNAKEEKLDAALKEFKKMIVDPSRCLENEKCKFSKIILKIETLKKIRMMNGNL